MREEIIKILIREVSEIKESLYHAIGGSIKYQICCDSIDDTLNKITALIERESGVEKSIDDVIELVKIDQSDKGIILQYNTQGVIDILNAMKNRFNPPKSEEV